MRRPGSFIVMSSIFLFKMPNGLQNSADGVMMYSFLSIDSSTGSCLRWAVKSIPYQNA